MQLAITHRGMSKALPSLTSTRLFGGAVCCRAAQIAACCCAVICPVSAPRPTSSCTT